MSTIAESFAAVRQRMKQAAAQRVAGGECRLLAVSKTFGAQALREAFETGQRDFGENYVAEALEKQRQLADLPIQWHFIGHIQSNKTKDISRHFHWVHSVDRIKVAQRLSGARQGLPPLNVCLQVNLHQEASKGGIPEQQLVSLANQVAQLPHLRLRGLMLIPPATLNEDDRRAAFQRLRTLMDEFNHSSPTPPMDTLSMGMSSDLEAAVQEGATWIRIGRALFGDRQTKPA